MDDITGTNDGKLTWDMICAMNDDELLFALGYSLDDLNTNAE